MLIVSTGGLAFSQNFDVSARAAGFEGVQLNKSCKLAVNKAIRAIHANRGSGVVVSKISVYYKLNLKSGTRLKPPIPGRGLELLFHLDSTKPEGGGPDTHQEGNTSAHLFARETPTLKIARKLFPTCPTVGTVAFWLDEFGYSWSLTPVGTAIQDQCISRGEALQRGQSWNEWICN
jgi:hypothetical protein